MNIDTVIDQPMREYDFTNQDFACVKRLIYQRAGISLAPSRSNMVYTRLVKRLRETGYSQFKDYLAMLEENSDSGEWESFVNALTTNLTSFFREAHHFEILTEYLKRRKPGQTIKIWCSASSTGEEPYSLAMTAVEAFDTYMPPVRILATDIDTNVLATAQAGVYSMNQLENFSDARLKRFFLKGKGSNAAFARIRPELRNLVAFKQLNLLDRSWPLKGPFDAIFCRNVMIYFDKPTQHQLLEKFAPLLAADGLLFVGHSESFQYNENPFKLLSKTVYELINKPSR